MDRTLVIPQQIRRQIEQAGVGAYPDECCGILIGRDVPGDRRIIDRLVPMGNVFDPAERYHRFTIDPAAQLAAEKSADAEGKAVVGFYHSHPDHPARPSEYDRTHVPPWSFYSHIIVAIAQAKPAEMTAWRMDEDSQMFVAECMEDV